MPSTANTFLFDCNYTKFMDLPEAFFLQHALFLAESGDLPSKYIDGKKYHLFSIESMLDSFVSWEEHDQRMLFLHMRDIGFLRFIRDGESRWVHFDHEEIGKALALAEGSP